MSQLKDNSTTLPTTTATAMVNIGISSLPNSALSGSTITGIANTTSGSVSNGTMQRTDPINQRLNLIEERLAILTPDLVKLEKFAALKQAYDNYKLIETLCKDQP
jgi:hypothetical protein